MSRRTAREYAYKLVFEFLFSDNEADANTKLEMLKDETLTEKDQQYIECVLEGVKENYSQLVMIIADNAHNFRIDRIFKPDLAGLLVACYEMKYMSKDIPMSVSISEVVELVKAYSTEKSSQFVNGVLAGVYRQFSAKE